MTTGVLVALGGADYEGSLLAQLEGSADVRVVRRCVDVPDLLAAAATHRAAVALVSPHLGGLGADVVARLRDQGVMVSGVAAADSGGDTWLRRIGVTHVLSVEALADVASFLARSAAQPTPTEAVADDGSSDGLPRGSSGRTIAVWGPTGAPGRSVVALGLAAELSHTGATTLLVDADVYGGAQAQLLGILDESSGLLAAARAANSGTLDETVLARNAREVNSTLRVLTGLPRADRWTEVRPALLRSVLATANELAAFTVVDCGFCLELDEELSFDTVAPRRNGATLVVLEQADEILAVGSADPVGLSRLARGLTDLYAAVPGAEVSVVVNRMRSTLGWSTAEVRATIARFTGAEVRAVLPDDPAICDKALVHGQSVAECGPNSRLSKALRSLAESYTRGAYDAKSNPSPVSV